MKTGLRVIAFAILLCATNPSAARDRAVDVHFSPGSSETAISESIGGRDRLLFHLGAEAGQTLSVFLDASNRATTFNIYAPGSAPGDKALAIGELTDPLNSWTGALPTSGTYTIAVFLIRAAARRGENSNISIRFLITGDTGEIVQSDFADGLTGGPDFWTVALSVGNTLNLRDRPSTGNAVIAELENGQILRNLGCRMAEGRRWCRVATLPDPVLSGWTAGDFLVETAGTQLD
ncbi:MAG: SH3 domain-containing protein [Pseudomonadota bacterium]